ncbi:MAG TPA: UvrD-helicase domain-containing protein [Gemmatimonadaceae bacterium]|nr:UvrD-helicase domain-containing protein [Gemmatimonadaceae bacterium]
MVSLAQELAATGETGYVKAPAGFGKTHLIAEAISYSDERQLVLTHTFAGVNAIRRKLREAAVPSRLFRVDTIASWSLRLSLSFRNRSGWSTDHPENNREWNDLYRACSRLLKYDFARRILRASYAGLYIDEYQDCSAEQHELVMALATHLPCRILGDPLQAIFDFDDDAVDWARDVESKFRRFGDLNTPHRWIRVNRPEIGGWLITVRNALEDGGSINLGGKLPRGVRFKAADTSTALFLAQANACRFFSGDRRQSAIAIHAGAPAYKEKCHKLARAISGSFTSIEEIEGRTLRAGARKIQSAKTDNDRLSEVLGFASKCMTSIDRVLPQATKNGRRVEIKRNTRNPSIAMAANAVLEKSDPTSISDLLQSIRRVDGVELTRGDLYYRMLGVLRKHALYPNLSLSEAVDAYQTEFRHSGRRGGRWLIGTTLLVKGLEFDHGIVLDANSLSRKELYVALTRGSRSVTILGTDPMLNPPA